MPVELRLGAALLVSVLVVVLLTPMAIIIARRLNFFDRPLGYKGHTAPTPYLGGAAVIVGFLASALTLGGGAARFTPIVGCVVVLWMVGTIDDAVGLGAAPRLVLEAGTAVVLWGAGLGWPVGSHTAVGLLLTVAWVVSVVTAFNLLDNIDGAASTVAVVCALGTGALAVIGGDPLLGALDFGLGGAALGFLRYNLASPARIFLGDGGSMVLGAVVASSIMVASHRLGWSALPVGVLLAGVPILDTTLVVVSRSRRGRRLTSGGRDHLTHRLLRRLQSPLAVAAALGLLQCSLSAGILLASQSGRSSIILATVGTCLILGAMAVAILDAPPWGPSRAESPSVLGPAESGT